MEVLLFVCDDFRKAHCKGVIRTLIVEFKLDKVTVLGRLVEVSEQRCRPQWDQKAVGVRH